MTDYTLKKTNPSQDFVIIPNALVRDTSLSERSRAFLTWFQSLPDGSYLTANRLIQDYGLSRKQWRTLRIELAARNILKKETARAASGRYLQSIYTIDISDWYHGGPEWERLQNTMCPKGHMDLSPCAQKGTKMRPKGHQTVPKRAPNINTDKKKRPSTLEGRHNLAIFLQVQGKEWPEPTSGQMMPPTQEPKPLSYYQKLESLK